MWHLVAAILMMFPEIVPTREITTEIEKTFLVFSSVAVGRVFLDWAQCCSINSIHINPAALSVVISVWQSQVSAIASKRWKVPYYPLHASDEMIRINVYRHIVQNSLRIVIGIWNYNSFRNDEKKQFFKNMFTPLVYTNWPKMPSKKIHISITKISSPILL